MAASTSVSALRFPAAAAGALTDSGPPGQRERRVPAPLAAGLEVIAHRRTVHAVRLGLHGQLHELNRGELLRTYSLALSILKMRVF